MPRTYLSQTAVRESESAAARLVAQAQHANRLTVLLDERSELRGVVALADLVGEAVRWSA